MRRSWSVRLVRRSVPALVAAAGLFGPSAPAGAASLPASVPAPVSASAPGYATTPSAGGRQGATVIARGRLVRCHVGAGRPTYCGTLEVPLDRTDPESALITVGYAWVPASGHSEGTVLAEEGGPGYPSTGTSADFVSLFGPVLDHRDLLLVDARGTGRSTLITCRALQSLPAPADRPDVLRAAQACGDQLDHTWRRSDGTWQHGSQLFTTAATVADTADVVRLLGVGPVDLYGDSYGSWFAQSFMARHPELLRSVVLDSTYETVGLDPWYATSATVAHRAFDEACARSTTCPPGSSWARIGALATRLRTHPLTGTVPGTDGTRHTVTVDVRALVNMVNDAGYDAEVYRQLDPAVRAALTGDPTPLLRLYAQDIGWDYSDYTGPARWYSDGLYLAIACTDYPQLFDMRATPAVRTQQFSAAVAGADPSLFAPFTAAEWTGMLDFTETYAGCLTWPSPTGPVEPPVPAGAPLDPGHAPVLVLTGEFDSLTPDIGARHVAEQIGPEASVLESANNPHLVALENPLTTCGEVAVRRFVTNLRVVGPACLEATPALVLRAEFPSTLSGTDPGTVVAGHPDLVQRRAASLAWGAVVDAAYRFPLLDGTVDAGLRGGRVRYAAGGEIVTFHALRWAADARVDGRVDLRTGGTLRVRTDSGRVVFVRVGPLTPDGQGTVRVGSGAVRTRG